MAAKAQTPPAPDASTPRHPSCTRCGKQDAAPGGNWCEDCKEYMRNYQQNYRSGDEIRAFAAGVKAMRELLVEEFERVGSGGYTGYEIAQLIRLAPGPQRQTPQE